MTKSQPETLFDLPTKNPQIDTEDDGTRKDIDRLSIVYGELGFIPHSREELTRAMLVLDNREQPGGFASHLNSILRRQVNYEVEDPAAALRSIVNSIKGYADTTKGDKTSLLQILDEVEPYSGTQNFLELDKIKNLHGWEMQPGTKRGLGLINRHLRVTEGLSKHEWPGIDGRQSEEAIADMVATTRVYEALSTINNGMSEADARHDFWVDCLKQARRHMAVRQIASEALKKLGIQPS